MRLRTLNVGCFGGGTGLPSLLGGLKNNPWLSVHAVVTMFDSGGSSGQLRDELGVLPPGDVLKCALALARNEREARRVLLSRMPTLQHERLRGHTGGNLLLSMMERYSGDFLAAVDGLRALLGWAHGIGWIVMSLLCLAAVRARTIPLWLGVMVAVIGGIGPFAGSIGFYLEDRRLRRSDALG